MNNSQQFLFVLSPNSAILIHLVFPIAMIMLEAKKQLISSGNRINPALHGFCSCYLENQSIMMIKGNSQGIGKVRRKGERRKGSVTENL